jgi:Transposase DDE domain
MPAVENEAIAAHLEQLLSPLVHNQMSYYRQLGLRSRILGLPLMMAAVLTLLWRQVPSVNELSRMLARENLLWCNALTVSQQALSKRFLEFPVSLFERVFMELLPLLRRGWYNRHQRPLPTSVAWSRQRFERLWVVDGSTLEALFRHLGSLQDAPVALAGKIYVIVDLLTHLPVTIRFEENPYCSDPTLWDWLKQQVLPGTLLIFDRGFYDFDEFAPLVQQGAHWLTRLKKASYRVLETFNQTPELVDQKICLGHPRGRATPIIVRLIAVRHGNSWYRYITSVLDPKQLPPYVASDLYGRRWQIETAFNLVKRLLGVAYLWTGSLNGVKLQIWATWLFYALLLDLADSVADQLQVPTESISIEMLFRGLYHFNVAHSQGKAFDPIPYFTTPENADLAIVKRIPKSRRKPELDLSPYPALTTASTP